MNCGGGGIKEAELEEAKLGNRMREGHLQRKMGKVERREGFLFVWFFPMLHGYGYGYRIGYDTGTAIRQFSKITDTGYGNYIYIFYYFNYGI